MKKCKCKETCLLSMVYPNSDVHVACDDECYLDNIGKSNAQLYVDKYPHIVEKFNKIENRALRKEKLNKINEKQTLL